MAEESWHAARLIPTSGISGAEEQERRATSAVLAVMSAVREFAKAVLGPLGAPSGAVETFIEVPFAVGEHRVFPDGLIRVRRGARTWVALVEVKTGPNRLEAAQLESYLDVAREQGFDALLTISNEIPPIAGTHPTAVDKRKLKRVGLHHLSWTQVLTEAVMQKVHRGIADPDQAWILGELIRYLEHSRSGAMEFEDMGPSWVTVREAVVTGTLRSNDKGAAEVASRWDQLMRYACLRLGRQLGVEVQPVLSRKELAEPALRAQTLVSSLVTLGRVDGTVRIPNAVGPITITADLRSGRVTTVVTLDAPREGRALTRVNWLVRQLKNAPDTLRIDCFAAHARGRQPRSSFVTCDRTLRCSSRTRSVTCGRLTWRSLPPWERSAATGEEASSARCSTYSTPSTNQRSRQSSPGPHRPPNSEPTPTPTSLTSQSSSSQRPCRRRTVLSQPTLPVLPTQHRSTPNRRPVFGQKRRVMAPRRELPRKWTNRRS